MAFLQSSFELINTTGFFNFWHYRSTVDTLATIRASGYFNAAAGNINTGDLIVISPDSAGTGGINMLINTAGVITCDTGSPIIFKGEAEQAQKSTANQKTTPHP